MADYVRQAEQGGGFGYEEDDPTLDPVQETAPELEPEPAKQPIISKHWAALPTDEVAPEIVKRAQEYYQTIVSSGITGLWGRAHAEFYTLGSNGHEGSKIIEFGDDGEKLGVRSNQLRSLVRYMLTTATGDRPAVRPMAINTSAKAMSQIPTARKVLSYYHKAKRLERHLSGVALRALLYGKGYLWQAWDPTLGADGSGDLVYKACSPLEVAVDLERPAYDNDWFIVSRMRNKYDAAATHAPTDQEKYDRIVSMEKSCLDAGLLESISFGLQSAKSDGSESDNIIEMHFMHRKTPAVPKGRYVILIGEDEVLFDGPLQYDDLPINEMVPEEFLGAESIGYSSVWDLIGLQRARDSILSTCVTNFDAYGHNDMLLPDGVELSVETVRDGLNAIRYPMGEANKPSMLEKFSIPEEVFKLADMLQKDMETNTGVNSVARGDPQTSLQTGPALALVQAQAIHFQSSFIGSYIQLLEDSGTTTIRCLKRYATTARIAAISGPNDPDGMIAFSSEDIDQIDRIEVEPGNAVSKTLAGKMELADSFLERGLIENVNQYFELLETGRLENLTDPGRKSAMQVDAENEILMGGVEVTPKPRPPMPGSELLPQEFTVMECPVVMTDHPVEHLMGHASVLNSPENRKNPAIVKAVTTHMLEHIKVWRETPPDILMLLDYPMPNVLPGEDPASPEGEEEPGKPQPPKGGKQPGKASAPKKDSSMPSLPKAPARDKFGRPTSAQQQ